MKQIGIGDEKVKMLAKRKYDPGCIAVDDLFALGLEKCKKSGLRFCLICPEMVTSEQVKGIANYYKEHTECFEVSRKVYEHVAEKGNTCGILLYTKIEQMNMCALEKAKLVLVCDGIEISGNIGTMFRTAEAVGADAIIFINLRSKVFDSKVLHSSRGMMFNVPFCEMSFEDCTKALGEHDIVPVLCEPEQGTDFKEFDYKRKVALVVGSERFGADKRWFNVKDCEFLKIPMFGEMDSLNVATAASLILYEAKYGQKNQQSQFFVFCLTLPKQKCQTEFVGRWEDET